MAKSKIPWYSDAKFSTLKYNARTQYERNNEGWFKNYNYDRLGEYAETLFPGVAAEAKELGLQFARSFGERLAHKARNRSGGIAWKQRFEAIPLLLEIAKPKIFEPAEIKIQQLADAIDKSLVSAVGSDTPVVYVRQDPNSPNRGYLGHAKSLPDRKHTNARHRLVAAYSTLNATAAAIIEGAIRDWMRSQEGMVEYDPAQGYQELAPGLVFADEVDRAMRITRQGLHTRGKLSVESLLKGQAALGINQQSLPL